jgi:hypothetical protein
MAKVAFEDLSGASTPVTSNPFDGLLNACNNDPVGILTAPSTISKLIQFVETDTRALYCSSDYSKCTTKGENPQRSIRRLDPGRTSRQARRTTKGPGLRRPEALSCVLGAAASESQGIDRCHPV